MELLLNKYLCREYWSWSQRHCVTPSLWTFDATLSLQDSQPIINLLCVSSPPNLLECRRTLPMTSRRIALTSAERLGPRATERVSQSMLDDPLVLNRYQRIHVRLDICKMQMCAQHEKWGDRSLQLNEFVSTLSWSNLQNYPLRLPHIRLTVTKKK